MSTTKHFSFPASAPTTPAPASRSSKTDRHTFSPVTPQRLTSGHRHQLTSPHTPASATSSPYTPLSLRSFASSDGSMLDTPISVSRGRRLSLSMSPEVQVHSTNRHSVADVTENWRSRAKENGIKVTYSQDPHFADDEASERAYSENDYPASFTSEQVLLPPAFLSTHRRARAYSQSLAGEPALVQIPSTPDRRTLADLNTPPPKAVDLNRLKMKGSMTDPAYTRRRPAFGEPTSELFSIDEDEYAPYPQTFSPVKPFSLSMSLNDPFHVRSLSPITETAIYHNDTPKDIDTSTCSVCGRSANSLAILEPCSHPLCSGCLTSALNIVGEKDMQCAMCKTGVDNFHLQNMPSSGPTSRASPKANGSEGGLLSAFDPNELPHEFAFFDRAQGASTPVEDAPRPGEYAVLRIDNVPWDITPPMIIAWLKHPVVRVHVLLDRKGKTLSHAYVEMANEDAMKAALRTAQNAVLGNGKRARGVTVTRSSQEELMKALFPSWQGAFDGSRPSLAGLSNDIVISTLGSGLLSETELSSLLHLIRSPDSHFLKVPSLPFHSLISILSKFPADLDSRVFWSSTLRDMLYDVTSSAIQVLVSRFNDERSHSRENQELLEQLGRVALECQAFTSHQVNHFYNMLDTVPGLQFDAPPSPATSYANNHLSDFASHQDPHTRMSPASRGSPSIQNVDPFSALAREFGVDAHVVEALAQRLSVMC